MTRETNIRIGMIGAGKMGQAILEGLLSQGFSTQAVVASEPDAALRRRVQRKFKIRVTSDNTEAAGAEVVILAVKPQVMDAVLGEIRASVGRHSLVISIAAGRTLQSMQAFLPQNPLARVMPNLPATVGKGFSALAFNRKCRPEHKALVEALFQSVGTVIALPEKHFDAFTAVSGSGPAYVFYLAAIWQEAACSLGFSKAVARRAVMETLKGSIAMLEASELSAVQLVQNVASKGGTTEAALGVFERRDLNTLFVEALQAAAKRSETLSC